MENKNNKVNEIKMENKIRNKYEVYEKIILSDHDILQYARKTYETLLVDVVKIKFEKLISKNVKTAKNELTLKEVEKNLKDMFDANVSVIDEYKIKTDNAPLMDYQKKHMKEVLNIPNSKIENIKTFGDAVKMMKELNLNKKPVDLKGNKNG